MDAKAGTAGDTPHDAGSNRRVRVSGIDRALQVLDVLQEGGKPAGAYAIAKDIGAPLSTVYGKGTLRWTALPPVQASRALQREAAQARAWLLAQAAVKMGVPADDLQVQGGVVSSRSDPSRQCAYGQLLQAQHVATRHGQGHAHTQMREGGERRRRRGRSSCRAR